MQGICNNIQIYETSRFLMSKTNSDTEKRWEALAALGSLLRKKDAELEREIRLAVQQNAWFTETFVEKSIDALAEMLNEEALKEWKSSWAHLTSAQSPKKVGLILAGNIPLVGFHDVLCVLAAGHVALIKCSSQDKQLLPFVLQKLCTLEPTFEQQISYVEKLENFDAVIATGSNNSSRYFDYYFSKVPHIIRKNRNSIGIIRGDESTEELQALGNDIFDYFGLGCRNVSKLMVPKNYQFDTFFEAIESFKQLSQHHKYLNNYDYNKSILLVNGEPHLDNGFLLLKEDKKLTSALAVLHYETYENEEELCKQLKEQSEEIQCIACMHPLNVTNQVVPFGATQKPRLWDYADGVNVMDFLLKDIDTIPGK